MKWMHYLRSFWLSSIFLFSLVACTEIVDERNGEHAKEDDDFGYGVIPYGLEGSLLHDRKILVANGYSQINETLYFNQEDSIYLTHLSSMLNFKFLKEKRPLNDTTFKVGTTGVVIRAKGDWILFDVLY